MDRSHHQYLFSKSGLSVRGVVDDKGDRLGRSLARRTPALNSRSDVRRETFRERPRKTSRRPARVEIARCSRTFFFRLSKSVSSVHFFRTENGASSASLRYFPHIVASERAGPERRTNARTGTPARGAGTEIPPTQPEPRLAPRLQRPHRDHAHRDDDDDEPHIRDHLPEGQQQ